MTTAVFFCACGGILSAPLDVDRIRERLVADEGVSWAGTVELACGEAGKSAIVETLRRAPPESVVFVACSPREQEATFRKVMVEAGLNPFLMQIVNVREHVAWVTPDRDAATEKAIAQIRAAVRRVRRHEPLEPREIDVDTGAVVIGGGPAGLAAALTLAEAGRKVVLVEKEAILGGIPVRCEEVFPAMECGACILEPILARVLHGPEADRIEVLLQSEVEEVVGSFGTFRVRIRRRPRYIDPATCIGCSMCIDPCPVELPDDFEMKLGPRKAIDFAFFGGLPSAPSIDSGSCLRWKGEECSICQEICPIPGAIRFDDREEIVERPAGAIVVAVGAALFDPSALPALGHGRIPAVRTSLEVERLLSKNGPTGGSLGLPNGEPPRSVAFVHCVGSLDPDRADYCSGICCLGAFKLNDVLSRRFPDVRITHYVRSLVAPGKEEAAMMNRVLARPGTRLLPFERIDQLAVEPTDGTDCRLVHPGGVEEHDLVVLMPAVVPSAAAAPLSQRLRVALDRHGFFEERHGRVEPTRTSVRGIHLAGSCQAPMDIPRATMGGSGAAGQALAALVPGRKLELEAIHAVVDEGSCSGCWACLGVCPFRALSADEGKGVATADPVLCVGCGTCVAACPAGAIRGLHFTNDQIFAEIEGLLA
jgi:heterodisulfide reductase subunit A